MMKFHRLKILRTISSCTIILFIFPVLAGCSIFQSPLTVTNYPKAEVVFQTTIPSALPDGFKLVLEIVDDVTGLYFNSSRFEMAKKDDYTYFIRIPLTLSSEVKYRYLRVGSNTDYEFTPQNQQVRFRILRIDGPAIVQDVITTWIDSPYKSALGRIRGQLIDKDNNAPVPNQLICAGGLQTVSASDGTFILEGLIPGTHNLVVYSMDGAYETFQQGATVAEGATTPAIINLTRRQATTITFNVTILSGYDQTIPLRFISNSLSLGNSYADLSSGSSGAAQNYPTVEQKSKNKYSIQLNLPVGMFLRYKYSLGDGFWNSELTDTGTFIVRDLIVTPNKVISDQIATFTSPGVGAVNFNINTGSGLPIDEVVTLQLNPFGWMEPLPMVSTDQMNWHYTLYSPLHLLGPIEYRFCRNGDCKFGTSTPVENDVIGASSNVQNVLQNQVTWNNLGQIPADTTIVTDLGSVSPRPGFITGIEFLKEFPPTWESTIKDGINSSFALGSEWVILSPTWTVSQLIPPLIEPIPGKDLLWNEVQNQISYVTLSKQTPVLFPQLDYTQGADNFWKFALRDSSWWVSWYDRYHRFMINTADIAAAKDVPYLIIGDPTLYPAMLGGTLANGESSSPPSDADDQWRQLITDIRSRYSGGILGVAVVGNGIELVPSWLDSVDGIYILYSPAINESNISDVRGLYNEFSNSLDNKVQPIYKKFHKPVIIGLGYPSNMNVSDGCSDLESLCTTKPTEVISGEVDFPKQTNVYTAAVVASSSKEWVSGFISRGFYPYITLQDTSSSIYGKPVTNALWFWFHYILNKAP